MDIELFIWTNRVREGNDEDEFIVGMIMLLTTSSSSKSRYQSTNV